MKKLFFFLSFCLALLSASATTYYIDYAGGNDLNNGLTTGTAWKRAPRMAGFVGSYSHTPGDRYIFKGGVTWPADALPLNISTFGGSSLAVQDYYGVDPAWYSGGSWSRPIFDGQDTKANIIYFYSGSYITIDNIDIRGNHGVNNYGDCSVKMDYSTYVTLTNCWIHHWHHDASMTADGQIGGVYHYLGSPNTGTVITHCEIGNDDGDGNSGTCVYFIETVEFTKLHDAPEGILHGGKYVHDCEFWNFVGSYDGVLHPNVTFLDNFGTDGYFYNNWLHGNNYDAMFIYLVGSDRASQTHWVYNNVCVSTNLVTVTIDTDNHACAMNVHLYNNTFVQTRGGQITCTSGRTGGSYNILDVWNNHFIGAGGSPSGVSPVNYSSGDNITHATLADAASAGYTMANYFAPTVDGNATYQTGTNLSFRALPANGFSTSRGGLQTPLARPGTGPWDVGGYQYQAGGGVAPVAVITPASLNFSYIPVGTVSNLTIALTNIGTTNLVGTLTINPPFSIIGTASYNIGTNDGQVFTVRFSPLALGLYNDGAQFNDNAGNHVANVSGAAYPVFGAMPMILNQALFITPLYDAGGGCLYQFAEVLDPLSGGVAVMGFTLLSPQDVVVTTTVNAPADNENSWFVNIDGEPQAPAMVWDITNLTAGVETRTVSWRGTGTFDSPQYVPKIFTLAAGTHYLIFRGREANCTLCTATISAYSPCTPVSITLQPQSQTIVSQGGLPVLAFLSVGAVGTSPLAYQWTRSGTNLPGATLSGLATQTDGPYTVIVTNACGAETSAVATITTVGSPFITTQPSDVAGVDGAGVSFAVVASGTTPLAYQWYKAPSTVLAGKTNPSFFILPAFMADAGSYYCIVTNAYGAVQSRSAVLTMAPSGTSPSGSIAPNPVNIWQGESANLVATMTGSTPITYQWKLAGTNLPGATTTTYSITNAQLWQSGTYNLAATNAIGYTILADVVTVNPPPPPQPKTLRITQP